MHMGHMGHLGGEQHAGLLQPQDELMHVGGQPDGSRLIRQRPRYALGAGGVEGDVNEGERRWGLGPGPDQGEGTRAKEDGRGGWGRRGGK